MKTILIDLKTDREIEVSEDTQYVLLPDKNIDTEINFNLVFNKEGVSAEILAMYHLKDGEKVKLTTSTTHKSPHTSCLTKVKTVLGENSRSDFTGKIIIDKNAQQTNSYLQDDVLVTGNNTLNSSSPILQIDANDVKASHGATTGRINQNKLYYLMSRGFSREEAENLVVEGFFSSLINEVKDPEIQSKIKEYL